MVFLCGGRIVLDSALGFENVRSVDVSCHRF